MKTNFTIPSAFELIILKPIPALVILLGIFLLVGVSCDTQESTHSGPVPKALYIILDGISADILEETDTPHIDRIIEEGGYTRATTGGMAGGYSESPTASAIGYNNLLTGTWANKHNVYDNDIESPNYEYWSLYRLIETVKPELKTAIYSSWTDNRTKLAGEGLEAAGRFKIDIVRDGYDLDTLAFPQDSAWVRLVDQKVTEEAAESIERDAPDFSWVYLWYPDDTGHEFGETDEHIESIKNADRQVGKIWEAVQVREAQFNEDWLVVVTTDHGRALPDGKDHGDQSERERTVWFATNAANLNAYFRNGDVQHVDLYPSIARHLDIEIPEDLQKELDGVPFVGPLSVSSLSAEFMQETSTLNLKWKAWQGGGTADIKVAKTNHFKTGGEDEFHLLETVDVASENARVDLSELWLKSAIPDTVKVVLEGEHNSHTAWAVRE